MKTVENITRYKVRGKLDFNESQLLDITIQYETSTPYLDHFLLDLEHLRSYLIVCLRDKKFPDVTEG